VAGGCVSFCSAGRADCNADLATDGCETAIDTSVTNCGACGIACSLTNATAGCAAGDCTVATCDTGYGDCDTDAANGCEANLLESTAHCGACGNACTGLDLCVGGTCGTPVGDQCSNAFVLSAGMNTFDFLAASQDYMTTVPSCVLTGSLTGPDLVASYTPTSSGQLNITMTNKADSQRHVMVLSDQPCGTVTELACGSEFVGTTITMTAEVTAGTTYYLYISDTTSGSGPLPAPIELSVQEILPTCTPGTAGVLAGTYTRVPTGLSSFTEYYVAADADPTGYLYVGGTGDLHRMPKAGGATEDVETLASLGTTHLGYDMAIDGLNIYTLDATTTSSGRLYRISADGGATWSVADYASFATNPSDDFRTVIVDGAQLLMMTEEFTTTVGTEVWAVSGAATPPEAATSYVTFAETGCTGLAADSTYLYAACDDSNTVVRVNRTTGAVAVVTNAIPLNATKNAVVAVDTTADGIADVLYVQVTTEEVHYVCTPAASGLQYTGVLVDWSEGASSTANYGLALDPASGDLWAWDDDTREFIRIQ
jgi:hypothetical protein